MGLVPFALSVHQLVSSVGADIGFAAILGLAILVLLYFAQARETANLREQAVQAAQRVEQLEARIAQVARRQTVTPASPRPTPAGAAVAVSRVLPGAVAVGARGQMPPGPPAGVAGPALGAATRLIAAAAASPHAPAVAGTQAAEAPPSTSPDGSPVAQPVAADVPAAAPAAAGVGAIEPAGAAVVAARPAVTGEERAELAAAAVVPLEPTSEVTAVAGTAHEEPGGVPPATFAGAGNGASRDPGFAPPVADRDPLPLPGRDPLARADRGTVPPPERPRARPIPPRRAAPEPEPPRRRSRAGRLLALLAGAAIAGGVVVLILVLTQGSSTPAAPPPPRSHAGTQTGKKGPAINPSTVTVAVLNGTAVNGLAGRTAAKLSALGYKQGTVATASNQTFTATIVAYTPGHRAAALQVARALKLGPSAVQPIDANTQAVACPQSPCNATVVVTTGADIASH